MSARAAEPGPGARRRRALAAFMAAILASPLSCVHLFQPQTYYLATDRVAQQREEYLDKELIAGLPESLFRRWYTRDDSWADGLRPYILKAGIENEGGRTVYQVGSGRRTIAEVTFKDGRLEEVGGWHMEQGGLQSMWLHGSGRPRETVTAEMLERLDRLDPLSEPFQPEERPDREALCRLGAGTVLESMQAMAIRRSKGRRRPELVTPLPAERPLPPGPGVLPAMTRLAVKRWGAAGMARLVDARDGTEYVLNPWEGDFCPAGACAPLGGPALLTRDLVVATGRDAATGRETAIAVVPTQVRIPVWMERPGVLRVGAQVRPIAWDPCGSMKAEIEVPGAVGLGLPATLKVPVAPPGLFARPAGQTRGPSGRGHRAAAF